MNKQRIDKEIFANRLREAIKESGMTTKEIGERMGLSNASISRYQSGQLIPKNLIILELSKVLDVDSNWLIGLCEEKSNNKVKQAILVFREQLEGKEITDEKIDLVRRYIDLVFRKTEQERLEC